MVSTLGKAKKARGKDNSTNKHKKSITSIIDDIIANSDIILEVLDARFIEKTRQLEIEKKIKHSGKVLIYVINKSDLVDISKIRREVELEKLKFYVFLSSKERNGSSVLRKLIQKEAKKLHMDSVNIGVIGYPNTGKSSLINILAGRSSAKVSSESGYTKSIQKIKLSNGLYLIDTPGIISLKENKTIKENLVKYSQIGAVAWNKIKQPDIIISELIKEYPDVLEKYYQINAKGDSELLIGELGKRLNYLKKGKKIDEIRTAKQILRDWQEGKIRV